MKTLLTLFLVVLMTGCAAKKNLPTSGELATPKNEKHTTVMARDVVEQLTQKYPAATTTLVIHESVDGVFGKDLLSGLRKGGYALVVLKPSVPGDSEETGGGVVPKTTKSLDLGFVVDQPAPNLYRVTVSIDKTTLSRAYAQTETDFFAAGAWVIGGASSVK